MVRPRSLHFYGGSHTGAPFEPGGRKKNALPCRRNAKKNFPDFCCTGAAIAKPRFLQCFSALSSANISFYQQSCCSCTLAPVLHKPHTTASHTFFFRNPEALAANEQHTRPASKRSETWPAGVRLERGSAPKPQIPECYPLKKCVLVRPPPVSKTNAKP